MSAPNYQGRGVLDRIAGFSRISPLPSRTGSTACTRQRTSEMFERYLPYAIALGCREPLGDRYPGVLAAAAAAGGKPGFPSGIPAAMYLRDNTGSFVSGMSAHRSPAASAQRRPLRVRQAARAVADRRAVVVVAVVVAVAVGGFHQDHFHNGVLVRPRPDASERPLHRHDNRYRSNPSRSPAFCGQL